MQFIRGVVRFSLLVFSYCMYFEVGVNSDNYVTVASVTAGTALGAAVALPALLADPPATEVSQVTPALMFGLFLHYAFLRLPLAVAAGTGWAVWLAAIAIFPGPVATNEGLRLVVYVAFANVFGMIILHLIESRERNLFFQKREAWAAREEARVRQSAAEDADRQKTRLIAAVSHDLRQPMTAALAYVDLMLSRLSREDYAGVRDATRKAQSALAVLGTTLDHLLTAARYDSATEPMDIRSLELRAVMQALYEAYMPEAEKRGVELRVRLPRCPTSLHTDERSIHRVLGNLISNAVKFNNRPDAGGRVLVSARFRGDHCRIDVWDTGIGIARDAMKDIWQPYVQLNNIERDRERGLGLGLFLVRRIVEQLPGHTITMDSRPGRGSRFTVTVPATRFDARPYEPPPDPMPSVEIDLKLISGAVVLMLEDDRDTRLSLVELLESWGVKSIAAPSFFDIVSRTTATHESIDALICDYRLASGINGIDAIASLRQRLGYAPHAVLITGEPDVEPLRARAGPDTVVLHKPFAPEALARSLLDAVQARRNAEPA